jgi:hypothetical protein
MAYIVPLDRQKTIVHMLAESTSIRSIERITGTHRDTVMRLGVRIGQGCDRLLNAIMRDVPSRKVEVDEVWGFIGKKRRNVTEQDSPDMGDVWTFVGIDADTKLVPAYRVGKRDVVIAIGVPRRLCTTTFESKKILAEGQRMELR